MNLRFETWQGAEARRHYLDVLRGVAALLVLVSHSDHAGLLDIGLQSLQKGIVGALGVYMFFMLSGFLIWTSARNLGRPGATRLYAIHRFTRLVPLYLVNLAFVLLLLPHLESAFKPVVSMDS
ncbi:MAG TPA: acyltransferase family protein, partial [Ramlibacter sp.]|nr:acyltransferase family protein [Ramlibacter sp.]